MLPPRGAHRACLAHFPSFAFPCFVRGRAAALLALVLAGGVAALLSPTAVGATSIVETGDDGADGATGEDGAAGESLVLALDDTSDTDLGVRLTGGDGGNGGSPDGGGGAGGAASFEGTRTATGPEVYEAGVRTVGGDGGNGGFAPGQPGGTGGDGGAAHAGFIFESDGDGAFTLSQSATGGRGGAGFAGAPGAGGDATSSATFRGAGTRVEANSLATGGIGGSGRDGHDGARGGHATAQVSGFQADASTGFYFAEGGARGGVGGSAVGGGDAGRGGDAHGVAHVEARDATSAHAEIFAVGGDGGSTAFVGGDGDGGDGGDGIAEATGTSTEGVLVVEAVARGGAGGAAAGAGHRAGVGGTGEATAHGASTGGGLVLVRTEVRGGDGGEGREGAEASAGGSVDLVDTASGFSAGQLVLQQRARGGDGGQNLFSAPGASGGDARSALDWRADRDAGDSRLILLADGGDGGRGTDGGDGGDAEAAATLVGEGDGELDIQLYVEGGEGGDSSTDEASGGNGGRARLGAVEATSLGGGVVRVIAEVTGGDGGDAGRFLSGAGDGADVHLDDAIRGATDGALSLHQTAEAGSAGAGRAGGIGRAGEASSALEVATAAAHLTLEALAKSGHGSDLQQGETTGEGAAAAASAMGENTAGGVTLVVSAQAGSGGDGEAVLRTGDGADATAVARAVTHGDGDAIHISPGRHDAGDRASAFGGGGGSLSRFVPGAEPRVGGDGGDAESSSHGLAHGDASVFVLDRAASGRGGRVSSRSTPGIGGDAGHATSRAFGRNRGASEVTVSSIADGGFGGDGRDAAAGAGGNASAEATGRSHSGRVKVESIATAGRGGFAYVEDRFRDLGRGGAADARAFGFTGGTADVLARAHAGDSGSAGFGAPATATALAIAQDGVVSAEAAGSYGPTLDLRVGATADVHRRTLVSAGVGAEASPDPSSDASVHGVGFPDSGGLAWVRFAARSPATPRSRAIGLEAALSLDLDADLGDLDFVFSDLQVTDFEELAMRIEVDGVAQFSRIFADAGDLEDFLSPERLGAADLGLDPNQRLSLLDLRFSFDWTVGTRASRFSLDLGVELDRVLGFRAIPEPSVASLIGAGLVALGIARRTRRTGRR